MKRVFLIITAISLLLFGGVGIAQAMLIDFTSETWKDITGTTVNKTIGGIGVTLQSSGDYLTWNDEHGDIDLPHGLVGLGDGIGIGNDEISLKQELTISFTPDVIIKEIYLLDLFSGEPEWAKYKFEGGSFIPVGGVTTTYGFVDISTGSTSATSSITFKTDDSTSTSDYAVAGMTIAPVPEPATMLLFGTGLLGLAGLRLRKKK